MPFRNSLFNKGLASQVGQAGSAHRKEKLGKLHLVVKYDGKAQHVGEAAIGGISNSEDDPLGLPRRLYASTLQRNDRMPLVIVRALQVCDTFISILHRCPIPSPKQPPAIICELMFAEYDIRYS